MTVVLARVDDRLVHGQVVIGWGRPLDADLIVLVDAQVAAHEWEQDIYRMAVPEGMEILFADAAEAGRRLPAWEASQSRVVVLTGDIATMVALQSAAPDVIRRVNLGGLHHRPGRVERLRYVYLDPAEQEALRALAATGTTISAQDLPSTPPVPVERLL